MKKKRFGMMFAILIGSLLAACLIGRYPLAVADIWKICTGTLQDPVKRDIFLQIRLPRTLFAGMTGAALALAGLVYQEIFRNPLAAPDVLGVSGGACVGAAGAILLGGSLIAVQASALVFGMAAVFLTILLAGIIGHRNSVSMVLAGIVVKAVADAAVMGMKYMADPNRQLASIDYWIMGSFQNIRWQHQLGILPVVLVMMILLWLMRYPLTILSLGSEEAQSLGVRAVAVRVAAVLAAAALVASTVSVTGTVSWTGLIIPHMVRFWKRGTLRDNFAVCICAGGTFMIWMDTLARALTLAEIPVSILTSAAGAVFLLWVLIRRRRKGEAG